VADDYTCPPTPLRFGDYVAGGAREVITTWRERKPRSDDFNRQATDAKVFAVKKVFAVQSYIKSLKLFFVQRAPQACQLDLG
jgi:hypothetical protein